MSSDLFIHSCIKSGLYDYYEWAQSGLTGIPLPIISATKEASFHPVWLLHPPTMLQQNGMSDRLVCCTMCCPLTPTRLRNRLLTPLTRKPPDTYAIQSNGEANLWTILHYFCPVVALLLRKKNMFLLIYKVVYLLILLYKAPLLARLVHGTYPILCWESYLAWLRWEGRKEARQLPLAGWP